MNKIARFLLLDVLPIVIGVIIAKARDLYAAAAARISGRWSGALALPSPPASPEPGRDRGQARQAGRARGGCNLAGVASGVQESRLMALMHSTTVLQILLQQQEQWAKITPFYERMKFFANNLLGDMITDPRKAATVFRMRRAPQSDDMRQMLADLAKIRA